MKWSVQTLFATLVAVTVAPNSLAQDTIDANYQPDIESHTSTDSLVVKLTNEESGGLYTIADFYYRAGWVVDPHLHEHAAETFIQVEGRLDLRVDGKDVTLLPGAVLHIPPGVPHSAVSPIGGKSIGLFAPGGYEEFMRAEQALTATQKEDDEFMKEFREQFDIDIVPVEDYGLPYDFVSEERD